jgi:DNA-directed RNA polymerase specialized sigma24 family protein
MATASRLSQRSGFGSSPWIRAVDAPQAVEAMESIPKKWSLTKDGFDRLLAALDPDRDVAAVYYERLRAKLINYFDWRDCPAPEDHADEAINRVIRKLSDGEDFRDIGIYVLGIARMMLLEIARTREKERMAFERPAFEHPTIPEPIDDEIPETSQRVSCLEKCLAALPERSRNMIVEYYQGDGPKKIKRRKELAERLGLELNALRIRTCRLRNKLEQCMGQCISRQEQ